MLTSRNDDDLDDAEVIGGGGCVGPFENHPIGAWADTGDAELAVVEGSEVVGRGDGYGGIGVDGEFVSTLLALAEIRHDAIGDRPSHFDGDRGFPAMVGPGRVQLEQETGAASDPAQPRQEKGRVHDANPVHPNPPKHATTRHRGSGDRENVAEGRVIDGRALGALGVDEVHVGFPGVGLGTGGAHHLVATLY